MPLADHLHDTGDMTTPVSDSEFIELDDEVDEIELDDDDDLTEHAAPILEPLPALPIDRLSATTLDPGGSASIDPLSSTVLEPAMPPMIEPVLTELDMAPLGPSELDTVPRDLDTVPPELDTTVLSPIAATTRGHPPPAASFPGGPRRGSTPSVPFAPVGSRITPSVPFAQVGSQATSSVPLGAIAPPPSSSVPFTVPPWQSGQPANPAGGDGAEASRVARSWAVVALPPFDPAQFDRQRRIVLRISGGLVAVIILLALIAGRC